MQLGMQGRGLGGSPPDAACSPTRCTRFSFIDVLYNFVLCACFLFMPMTFIWISCVVHSNLLVLLLCFSLPTDRPVQLPSPPCSARSADPSHLGQLCWSFQEARHFHADLMTAAAAHGLAMAQEMTWAQV